MEVYVCRWGGDETACIIVNGLILAFVARPFLMKWIVLFFNLCFLFYLHHPLLSCQQHYGTFTVSRHVFLHSSWGQFCILYTAYLLWHWTKPFISPWRSVPSDWGIRPAAVFTSSIYYLLVLALLLSKGCFVAAYASLIALSVSLKIVWTVFISLFLESCYK